MKVVEPSPGKLMNKKAVRRNCVILNLFIFIYIFLFCNFQLTSVFLSIGGIVLMGYSEGFGSSNAMGILFVVLAALGSASYQVCGSNTSIFINYKWTTTFDFRFTLSEEENQFYRKAGNIPKDLSLSILQVLHTHANILLKSCSKIFGLQIFWRTF